VPKIGLRIVKAAVAVFLCLVFDILVRIIFKDEARVWFSPFFSSLAAVYSLNNRKENSLHLAKIRSFGSILGGVFAVVYLFFVSLICERVNSSDNLVIYDMVYYCFISIGILFLIYLTVLFKLNEMAFIATLTFLATSVGNLSEMPFYVYAINRTASTIIGVFISLGVNLSTFHLFKNKQLTFVSCLDGVLIRERNELSNFQKYNLEKMLDDGLDIYFNTNRSPATLIKIFHDIALREQMVIMNGSATFDLSSRQFNHILTINKNNALLINQVLDSLHLNYFSHTIIDNTLQIYYKNLNHSGDKIFYETRRNEYFRNFAKSFVPEEENVSYYIIICEKDMSNDIIERIKELKIPVEAIVNPFKTIDGVVYEAVRIYASKGNKFTSFSKIKKSKEGEVLVALGHTILDLPIFACADYKICYYDACSEIKNEADLIISADSQDEVIKVIKKMYYHKIKL